VIQIFTDGSVDNRTKTGVGAVLLIKNPNVDFKELPSFIQLKIFEDTSSTKLELQTFLWALGKVKSESMPITFYTDSQNIISLLNRRIKLEAGQFKNKKGVLLKNHLLYRSFYQKMDNINSKIIKLQGHKPGHLKDNQDRIFSLVDKASRAALQKLP